MEMPGLLLNECNGQPCSQYKFKLYDERVILLYLSVYIIHLQFCFQIISSYYN